MSLRQIDLNLVPVLQALLRERSVSRAADVLGLSQPAVSAALRRIRHILGDQLLLRVGGRLELTPRALELIGPLEASCETLENLFVTPSFDPASAERTFIIATPDVGTFLLAPKWLSALEREAGRVRMRFIDITDRVFEQLTGRAIDFAVMPSFFLEDLPSAPLHFRPLFQDRSVALFRKGHPLSRSRRVTQDALANYRMVAFHPSSDVIERKRVTDAIGSQIFSVAAFVPQTTLPPFLLLDTDYFTIVSSLIAEQMVKILPLEMRELAFETANITMGIAWSPIQDSEPGHRWFREMTQRVALG